MEVKNIAILGDSWAWGEWSFVGETNMNTHNGTYYYLQQEYPKANIVNFAKAGGSNLYQLDYIASNVGMYNFKKDFDVIICFWTDPGRDILDKIEEEEVIQLSHFSKVYYEDRCKKTSDIFLKQLNSIGIPVILVGGQVSLPTHIDRSEYSNLYFLIDRITNLIDNPFWDSDKMCPIKGTMDNTIDWMATERIEHLNLTEEFKAELVELRKTCYKYFNFEFFPDLGHGGRALHRLASIKIIDEIGKLNAS
jgi:hypothetical protein|tara:strand:- start:811 stop:1560 length:750 start_codon:yes stop_codon:yes gene_type:complete